MLINMFFLFFLLGIGRNLPSDNLYFFGLGAADLGVCVTALWVFLDGQKRNQLKYEFITLRQPIILMSLISFFAIFSMSINSFRYGAHWRDLFEIVKYFYLLFIMVFASYSSRHYGVVPAVGFSAGIIVSGIVAVLNPMNPDVLGTPQMFNPNVIGNVLSVAVFVASLIILRNAQVLGSLIAVFAAVLGFFTFSKGTWLMIVFGLMACLIAISSSTAHKKHQFLNRFGKYFSYFVLVFLSYVVYEYWEVISLVVEAKIYATDFDASAAEGGSFSARVGLILSAIYMFLMNPILGVGISNYEQVNQLLQHELGDAFYDDDNPNSAFFYVLACMGLPAFILYISIFIWFLFRVSFFYQLSGYKKFTYVLIAFFIFFIGGNVQLEMLTAYYYWVVIGIVNTYPATTKKIKDIKFVNGHFCHKPTSAT